jgi:hypothetical protein
LAGGIFEGNTETQDNKLVINFLLIFVNKDILVIESFLDILADAKDVSHHPWRYPSFIAPIPLMMGDGLGIVLL